MNDIIPTDQINEGLSGLFALMPIPFVILVLMTTVALGIVKFNGETIKYYRLYIIGIIIILTGAAYWLMPNESVMVKEKAALLISVISSLFFTQLFIYWRKSKTKKK